MTDTIWKFGIMTEGSGGMGGIVQNDGEGDYFDIPMAAEAVPLSVQPQRARTGSVWVNMWIRMPEDAILPDYPTPPRRFYICGTGHKLHPKAGRHLSTFQLHDGALVFHVFEEARDGSR